MEIVIRPSSEEATRLAAEVTASAVRENPDLVLGLATGRTMERLYEWLVLEYECDGVDFSRVSTFNLDEYVGLPATDPQSYAYYAHRHFFSRVNIDLANTHVLDGVATDVEGECARYENCIKERGGIDLQILGIGVSGHIGFNEAGSPFSSRTRPNTLSAATLRQNGALFPDPAMMPHRALTMGVGTILESERCLLIVTGREKADIISKAVDGPFTEEVAASALQRHPSCMVILDEESGQRLKKKDEYRHAFDEKSCWEPFR